MRALETRVGRLRDRLRELVTGAPAAEAGCGPRCRSGSTRSSGRRRPRGRARRGGVAGDPGRPAAARRRGRLDAASADLAARTAEQVRAWQGEVLDLVRAEGAGKRTTARLASLGVNGAGLTVMIAVFASTGGLTGAEVVVAGGTSALGQKVLEAIFGDQAVRALAARAREQLMVRVGVLLDEESGRFSRVLEPVRPPPGRLAALDEALEALERAR